jgi:hypothetical protein
MELIFKIQVLSREDLRWHDYIGPTKIDKYIITWEVSEEEKIKSVLIILKNYPVKRTENNTIDTDFSSLNKDIFKLATYLSNKIYTSTGIELCRPESVFFNPPCLVPETDEEKILLKNTPKLKKKHGETFFITYRPLDIKNLHFGFKFSQAYSFMADAKRVSSPFLKYEQYYKVIEFFFNGKGLDFDRNVSSYIESIDSKYNLEKIKELRSLRNRCIHPNASKGHVNPENLEDINKIKYALNDLKNLAELLLRQPPVET